MIALNYRGIKGRQPVVPLFYDISIRFRQPNVTGLTSNGLNLLELRRVRIE